MKGEIKMLEFLSFLALCIACKLIQFSLFEKSVITLLYIFCVILKYANKDKVKKVTELKKVIDKNINDENDSN